MLATVALFSMPKISHERWKVRHNVFDQFTLRLLFKLHSQGYFEELQSPVSLGKEANIFTARTKEEKPVIVKIYRLESCNFNKMYDYIKCDPRYVHLKKQRRKVIFSWVQREYRNIHIARKANVRVPTPLTCLHHIIVMEYIGDDYNAPQLKDQWPDDKEAFFEHILLYMKRLYGARLIHGDLSEYNILNYHGAPVFIDFSQATTTKNPNAQELLRRDIKNICNFFKKMGVTKDERQIHNFIVT